MLSTQCLPTTNSGDSFKPTEALAASVVQRIGPELRHISDGIAEFAEACTEDQSSQINQTQEGPHLSPEEAARKFSVSATTLRREFDAGRIDGFKIGRNRKLKVESVAQWCEDRGHKQTADRLTNASSNERPKPRKPPSYI